MKTVLIWLSLFFVVACTAPVVQPIADVPEEAQDADGVGGATAKVTVAKWLGQAVLQAITNITIQIKVEKNVN